MAELNYFIDLHGVELDESNLTWLHAMPLGTKLHPEYGKLQFTSDRLERYAANVKNRVRKIDLDIDYSHKGDPAKGHKAAGWVKDAEVRDDGLWIGVQFTDAARAEVAAGEWRYLSPEFKDEWADADGVIHQDVLFGAALTNRPFLKDLLPIAASEDYPIEKLRPPEKGEVFSELENVLIRTLALIADKKGASSGI